MEIKTKEQAIQVLQTIKTALDDIEVKHKRNCYIVVACINDVEAVLQFFDTKDECEV